MSKYTPPQDIPAEFAAAAPPTDPPSPAAVPELWTVAECARYLRRSDRWVWTQLRLPPEAIGSIPHTRLPGGTPRFIPADVIAWVAAGCPPAATFKKWNQRRKT